MSTSAFVDSFNTLNGPKELDTFVKIVLPFILVVAGVGFCLAKMNARRNNATGRASVHRLDQGLSPADAAAQAEVMKSSPSTIEVSGGEIPALRGIYNCTGTHEMSRRRPIYRKEGEVALEIYYWDDKSPSGNGQEPGWWIGSKTGSSKVVAFNARSDMIPPQEGWRVPWNGPEDMSVQVKIIPQTLLNAT